MFEWNLVQIPNFTVQANKESLLSFYVKIVTAKDFCNHETFRRSYLKKWVINCSHIRNLVYYHIGIVKLNSLKIIQEWLELILVLKHYFKVVYNYHFCFLVNQDIHLLSRHSIKNYFYVLSVRLHASMFPGVEINL